VDLTKKLRSANEGISAMIILFVGAGLFAIINEKYISTKFEFYDEF